MPKVARGDEPVEALLKDDRRCCETQAKQLRWFEPWKKALDWKPSYAK